MAQSERVFTGRWTGPSARNSSGTRRSHINRSSTPWRQGIVTALSLRW